MITTLKHLTYASLGMLLLTLSTHGESTIEESKTLNHVFTCKQEGYASYRIPALVATPKGTLLAFCEGRKHHAGDHGDIDLVFKRSIDNGKTWSPISIAFDNGNHVAGNPCPIVDHSTGRIYLLSCTSSTSEHAIMKGEGRRGIFIQHSDDDGVTWSQPRDISKDIYPENWRWYATGPCSGIQIREGKHKGRLVAPANHSVYDGKSNTYRAHSIYSDDQGKTWKLGASSTAGGNESQIAEAKKDQLYQTIRMQTHRKGGRARRYSTDGGASWDELVQEKNLPCPRCQGSVIRDYSQPGRLILSNPADPAQRERMTIRISEDSGKTWKYEKLINPHSSAYSDLTITKDDKIAILYEGGKKHYAQEGIVFDVVDPKDIKESK